MPLSAKNAGSWATTKAVFTKVAGTWKEAKGVWVRSGGVWRLQGGELTTVNIGGILNPQCTFDGSPGGFETGCTAAANLTAVPIYGWPPLTYLWERWTGSAWTSSGLGTLSTQTVLGGNTGYGDSVKLRVTVTDAKGTSKTSPETTVNFRQRNQNVPLD